MIVDFDVADGRIVNMQINGDFFLEPAEALGLLNSSLEGASIDTDEAELARLVHAAVPAHAELIGFSPEGIATAVRRALA